MDNKYHVFTVEMTHGCNIEQFLNNSQIVHAESTTPGGPYTLAPITLAQGVQEVSMNEAKHRSVDSSSTTLLHAAAPNATVLVPPFSHAPHAWRDPTSGALIVAFEGRTRLPESQQMHCGSP